MVNIFVKALDHSGKGRSVPKFGSVPHDVPLVELIEGRFRSEGLPSLKNARASGNRTCSTCSRRAESDVVLLASAATDASLLEVKQQSIRPRTKGLRIVRTTG